MIKGGESAAVDNFLVSHGWFQRFKWRANLTVSRWTKLPALEYPKIFEILLKYLATFPSTSRLLTKLMPLVVYHAESQHVLENILRPHSLGRNPFGGLNYPTHLWRLVLPYTFYCGAERYCRESNFFNILVILDNAPGHSSVLDDFCSSVKGVYRNAISLIQSMITGW